MANNTSIEWAGRSVNFFLVKLLSKIGWFCVKKSAGCANCYSEFLNLDPRAKASDRRRGVGLQYKRQSALELEPFFKREALTDLLRMRKATRIFPNDMTDTFLSLGCCPTCSNVWEDEACPEFQCNDCGSADVKVFWPSEWIQETLDIYDELAQKGHVIQSLTKRPGRMLREIKTWSERHGRKLHRGVWPGFSAEDQDTFDGRWPAVAECAEFADGVLWVSYEPGIGAIDMRDALSGSGPAVLGWGVVGGESGRYARPFHVAWAEDAVEQFAGAGVPLFVKQLGAKPLLTDAPGDEWPVRHVITDEGWRPVLTKKGGLPEEWPAHLRVRQFPEGTP